MKTDGSWFKGNTHLHSVASDGGKTFTELSEMYSGAGYDFLFRTDHWVCSDVARDEGSYPLVWFDGIELDGTCEDSLYHVVCLGSVTGVSREGGLKNAMETAREQGAFTILAHPQWCGNTFEDVHRLDFDGVEIYNHVCRWLNGKGEGVPFWGASMMRNPKSRCFAVDDAHLSPAHPGWDGGWIMVNAEQLTQTHILDAIRHGNYYSSCGPEIRSFSTTGGKVRVESSPVKFIRLVGPGPWGDRVGTFEEAGVEHAEFRLPDDWRYAYVELEDDHGNRAWTNNLIV